MDATYDAGMFDKDEQGWCSNVHELRVEGDALHVRRHGDRNGRDPFDSTATLSIGAIDLEGEIVALSSGYLFDLRARRLLSGTTSTDEEIRTTLRPTRSSLESFTALVLSVHRAIGLVPEGAPQLGELRVQTSPLDASHRVRSGKVSIGERVIAEVHDTIGPLDDVIGVNVRAGSGAGLSVSWHVATPDRLRFHGYLDVQRLAPPRVALRAFAP